MHVNTYENYIYISHKILKFMFIFAGQKKQTTTHSGKYGGHAIKRINKCGCMCNIVHISVLLAS